MIGLGNWLLRALVSSGCSGPAPAPRTGLQRCEIHRGPDRTGHDQHGPARNLDAYRDHGDPKARLEQDVKEARWVLERLPELGISIDKVTQQLEDEGVEKFNQPFDKLMQTLAQKSSRI